MSRDANRKREAVRSLARCMIPPHEHHACFECGEVSGATGVLLVLLRDGIITEAQVQAAVRADLKPWDAGIMSGDWGATV